MHDVIELGTSALRTQIHFKKKKRSRSIVPLCLLEGRRTSRRGRVTPGNGGIKFRGGRELVVPSSVLGSYLGWKHDILVVPPFGKRKYEGRIFLKKMD